MPTLTPETCFDCPAFTAWWDSCAALIVADPYSEHVLGCADDGWALDALLDAYAAGATPAAAVAEAVDGYDPTPRTPYDWFH